MRVVFESNDKSAEILSLTEALAMAEDMALDLVEIAPNASPPVCKIMDYGKFKYSEQKKQHLSKLKQKKVHTKEIKLRPTTDEHDFQTKFKKIKHFLDNGDKVKVVVLFRGRELMHKELGLKHLERIKNELQDNIIIEHNIRIDGRNAVMIIAPNNKKNNHKSSSQNEA